MIDHVRAITGLTNAAVATGRLNHVAAADSGCPLWLTSASWLPGPSHLCAEVLAALVTSLLTPCV